MKTKNMYLLLFIIWTTMGITNAIWGTGALGFLGGFFGGIRFMDYLNEVKSEKSLEKTQ